MDYFVTPASGGQEALHLIENEFFDVVITDLMMPDIDGVGVLKAAKAKSPKTEVLLLTASQSVKDAVEAMKNGASEYFQKPADLGEIALTLQRIESFKSVARCAEQLREAMDVTEHNAQETIQRLEMEVVRLSCLLSTTQDMLSDTSLPPEERISKVLTSLA
jgi:DNA-binding NtrC family response regulator